VAEPADEPRGKAQQKCRKVGDLPRNRPPWFSWPGGGTRPSFDDSTDRQRRKTHDFQGHENVKKKKANWRNQLYVPFQKEEGGKDDRQ